MSKNQNNKIGFLEATAIGIGGMVGGGIFAVLGLSVELARGAAPLAFFVAGMVALFTSYSYSRLSVTFPSEGGTVYFFDQAFGSGLLTGSANVLLWISYIIMLSLYSYAFGSYAASLLPMSLHFYCKHLAITGSIVLLTALNFFSVRVIGDSEEWIVLIKIIILVFFIFAGIGGIEVSRLTQSPWPSPLNLISGGMIIFLAYEGFELIANTAHEIRDPDKNLPKAFYTSVIFVIILYVLIATVTVGTLPITTIIHARDYALAEAARPALGFGGFFLIAVAAMLSTASAINATIYGAARLSFIIAKDRELPQFLEKKVWNRPISGLLITGGLTIVIANVIDLDNLSLMGSSGFLLIFAAVNCANVLLASKTKSRAWISALGAFFCFVALGCLVWYVGKTQPIQLWFLAALILIAVMIEGTFKLTARRSLHLVRKK
ncbi:amino acid transporter [Legionella steelei]|uniref:Amino acid transporter n=1 Tax=Legionella steelei TaxID=947033 RepID=A0A0W0ZCS9_9GAMM|nr:APC family permease [Legionella steelei]KTD66923.1 amino acid transporter [Legionella steelei]